MVKSGPYIAVMNVRIKPFIMNVKFFNDTLGLGMGSKKIVILYNLGRWTDG